MHPPKIISFLGTCVFGCNPRRAAVVLLRLMLVLVMVLVMVFAEEIDLEGLIMVVFAMTSAFEVREDKTVPCKFDIEDPWSSSFLRLVCC